MNDSRDILTSKIIKCAIEVHKTLGPGLLESIYQECLYYELVKDGLSVEKEKRIPITYDHLEFQNGYRIDLLVENEVVVELKSVDEILGIHVAQVLTYLKLGNYRVGLLLNFNSVTLKKGIKRIVNDYN